MIEVLNFDALYINVIIIMQTKEFIGLYLYPDSVATEVSFELHFVTYGFRKV